MSSLNLTVEFRGGAELLFGNKKKHELRLPVAVGQDGGNRWKIKALLSWLKENLLEEREELFVQEGTVRPGILVLVNDTDWELLGELEYELKDGDNVLFISTLHGG